MRRKIGVAAVAATVSLLAAYGAAYAAPSASSSSPHAQAGSESDDLTAAQAWFTDQRLAPNGAVGSGAYAAAAHQAALLGTTGATWAERTGGASGGNDFTDDPNYIDPTSGFSNSGAGDRWVAGRVTALAASPDGGTIFAGGADGGVWSSTDGGAHWTPRTDHQATMSVGALLTVADRTAPNGYYVYAGTGEANTNSDSYAGTGVLRSGDGGATWTQVGGGELDGALIFRMAADGTRLLAATSHGLYSYDTSAGGTWSAVLQPAGVPAAGSNPNLYVGNMISDVAVIPGTGGQQVLAVAGWRGGAPTNGFYVSTDGGAHFTYLANPKGWVPAKDEGRTTLAYSRTGSRLYAIVQSPYLLNVGTNGKTLLAGVYESASGSPTGPWTKIADSEKLQASGSAQAISRIGKGYGPGIQAWYNQFLAVDPNNADHLYLGLEEVYETQNGGANWNTIAPYWNFGFSCFSYSPFEGTCNHNQAHSDQHAAAIVGSHLYIGNDGGVYSKSITDHSTGNWTDDNNHLDVLQYYSAAESKDGTVYGGRQDNGSSMTFPTPSPVTLDNGSTAIADSVQTFGGDGGYTIIDPSNSKDVITEYVGLTALKSIDGGHNWQYIAPADPNPRFIAPIALDRTNASHLVAGGAYVWNSDSGIAGTTAGTGTSTDWQPVYDVRTAIGAGPSATVTALDAVTAKDGTEYVAAAWCGPCNPSFSTQSGFRSGVVELTNAGGTWHALSSVCTGSSTTCAAFGLPNRYLSGVRIDPANPAHLYLTASGYSRNWEIGPNDPGVGHVFQSTDNGATWSNVSGDLPDVPVNDVVIDPDGSLVVGTDTGAFTSSDGGATWMGLGTNLPNVVVDQLELSPDGGSIVAATHGRGVWTVQAP